MPHGTIRGKIWKIRNHTLLSAVQELTDAAIREKIGNHTGKTGMSTTLNTEKMWGW